MRNQFYFFLVTLFLSTNLNAALLTFTDRSTFESFLSNEIIDDLSGIPQGGPSSPTIRDDYSVAGNHYNCSTVGCADLTSAGTNWPYIYARGPLTFDFESDISAFGFDYVNTQYGSGTDGLTISLNGEATTITDLNTLSFFGIISTDSLFSSVDLGGEAYFYFDNVTYAPAVVPVPAAVWLFGSGLIGLIGIARRKKA